MDWLVCLKDAIAFMEENLLTNSSPEEVARHVAVSEMYLQRGFQILTGYSLGEYMRNRRLYLAAVELVNSSDSILDIALKYGYETPASFDKAFARFHGATPLEVRKTKGSIRSFLRLSVSIAVQGGNSMQFRIEKKKSMKVVGFAKVFNSDDSYQTIPKFWDEFMAVYCPNLMQGRAPVGAMEEYIEQHHIGELGVCIDDLGEKGQFTYMIAGYDGGSALPEGMTVREIAAGDWAVFDCTIATLQDTNTAIWKEWIPGNDEYELAGMYNVEWYSPEGIPGPNQPCQIWIPVKKK